MTLGEDGYVLVRYGDVLRVVQEIVHGPFPKNQARAC